MPVRLPKRGTKAASHLDAIRGVSALVVLAGHLRALTLVDANQIVGGSALLKLLYFPTGLGHQAVMVFFVLSGYFISAGVMSGLAQGRWSPRRYVTARLVRLYVVLIPALLLGLALDRLGLDFFGTGVVYQPGFGHVVPPGIDHTLGGFDLARNLAFLQTIRGPVLGTNGPLWSLANEFWYYVAFPLLALAAVPGQTLRRVAFAVAGVAVLAFIGWEKAAYFAVWLLGTAVAAAPSTGLSRSRIFLGIMGLAFVASLLFSRIVKQAVLGDVAIALTFALVLWGIVSAVESPAPVRYRHASEFLSGFSYTLYLVHVPFVMLGTAYLLRGRDRLQPTPHNLALMLGLGLAAIAYAIFVWALAERNTDRIRAWLDARTSHPRYGEAPAPVAPDSVS